MAEAKADRYSSVDALRQDRLGCYGYARRTTPRIDAFAQDAVKFSRALTPTPATASSTSPIASSTSTMGIFNIHDPLFNIAGNHAKCL